MVAVAGRTSTESGTPGGGAAVTVTVAEPWWPLLVAVIVTVPVARPETTPRGETLALVGSELAHCTVPLTVSPAASSRMAVSWPAVVTGMVRLEGVTRTVVTLPWGP